MKAIITITLSIVTFFMNAQVESIATTNATVNGSEITVTIPTASTKGKMVVGLYNEGNFMKGAPLEGRNGAIKDGKATVSFEDVAPGTYGIIIFHDKNDNNIMDFEANGMPLEDYAISNNVMSFGPPMWSDAKFEVSGEDIAMEIRL